MSLSTFTYSCAIILLFSVPFQKYLHLICLPFSFQLFHSIIQGYGTVGSACLSLLGSGGRGLYSWGADQSSYPCSTSCYMFHVSFAALRLVLLWLVTSVLLRNYRMVRAELYRPAVDLQDYEMVELFLRRLKMWMGLSRTKEVSLWFLQSLFPT